jgi:archaellum biogenesis ATPase FlaH
LLTFYSSSTVIEHLISRRSLQKRPRVAYYFFDFNDSDKQTLSGFLKSTVTQLCAQTDPHCLPEPLKALYDTCNGSSPSTTQLVHLLSNLNNGLSADFIVVDALDECPDHEVNRERQAFLDLLTELKGATAATYNIFISSRPDADISSAMVSLADSKLEVKGQGIDGDIHSHVVAYLSSDTRMKKWPQGVKDEVVKDLSEKANGM